MSGKKIRLNPGELKSLSNEIKALNGRSKEMMAGVQQEVDEAQQVWKGNTAEKYATAFTEVRKDVEKQMNKCLTDLSDALNKASKAMSQMEQEIAKSIRVGR